MMSFLRQAIEDYLTLRRSLGSKLQVYDRLLSDFVAHLERTDRCVITTAAAVEWAQQRAEISVNTKARRLGVVRGFAEYVRTLEPRTEVPPAELLPRQRQRPTPRLYTQDDIRALVNAARDLKGTLTPATYSTLIGLLAVTGMRLGEAVGLDRSDLNEREGLLIIRNGKFGKSREVPLHRTTLAALQAYADKRDRVIRRPRSPSFFLSQAGTRLQQQHIRRKFVRLLRQVGLSDLPRSRPTIHQFRHTFAVQTLIGWYEAGADVQARLPILSTYLGHVSPSSTYWYLTSVPELVCLAAQRLEQALGGLP
jgi:integrase